MSNVLEVSGPFWTEHAFKTLIMASPSAALDQQQFLRTVFDTKPVPTFIVDDDVRIQDFNTAASPLLGPESQLALQVMVVSCSING